MNYIIFNFQTDTHLIESFLESASLAHNNAKKDRKWFEWKFRDNPEGETILACAVENGNVVGCVAYGIQMFWLNEGLFRGALSFENFVHPEHQRKGIFKKLIALSEIEAQKRNIDILFVFPNKNSLPGYVGMLWSKLPQPEYWIKGNNFKTILRSFGNLPKSFAPIMSNLSLLSMPEDFTQSPKIQLASRITSEYLKWRFFTHPVAEYVTIENANIYSIIRMGTRGKLREGQVLFINNKNNNPVNIAEFVKLCKEKAAYDILSFSISKHNPFRKELKKNFFVKVPNGTNICYKILNNRVIKASDIQTLSLNAINYHTY